MTPEQNTAALNGIEKLLRELIIANVPTCATINCGYGGENYAMYALSGSFHFVATGPDSASQWKDVPLDHLAHWAQQILKNNNFHEIYQEIISNLQWLNERRTKHGKEPLPIGENIPK